MKLHSSKFISLLILILLVSIIIPISPASAANTRQSTPQVVGAEPYNNAVNVPVNTMIVVVFNDDMQESVTENAFSIEPAAAGDFIWLGTTTLIFKPDLHFNEETKYTITISTSAKNFDDENLNANVSWSFKTGKNLGNGNSNSGNDNSEEDWWKTWEPILTVLTIVGTLLIALFGIYSLRKKRGLLSRYIEKLDNTYKKYKWDPDTCIKKLIALKHSLKAKVSQGTVEEYHYIILDKRIDDYLEEVRMFKTSSKPKIVKILDKDKDEAAKKDAPKEDDTEPVKGPYKATPQKEELELTKQYETKKPRIIDDSKEE
jgi:hypothetical protein